MEVHLLVDVFCHSMVRVLVGALTVAGTGRRNLAQLGEVASSNHRCGEAPLMPTHGLVLEEVGHPTDEQLISCARKAHARRSLEKI